MRYRRWSAFVLVWLCLALFVPIAAAQSGTVIIDDNGVGIDESRIQNAAQPLANRGARVVVITTESGTDAYLNQKLQELGIAESSSGADLPADVLIYYVSMNDRISGVYYGSNFSQTVGPNAANLRQNYLNAGLRDGDPTRGLVDVITETANVVGSSGVVTNPPPVSAPSTSSSSADDSSGSGFWLFIGLVVVGGLALFVLPGFLKRRNEAKGAAGQLQDAQSRYAAARQAAGGAIADTGTQLRDASEKQRFDAVSYPSSQAQELAKRHQVVQKSFQDLQLQFDEIEERVDATPQPTVINLESAIGVYEEIKQKSRALQQELTSMDTLRKELDTLSAQAPGEVDRVKKF